jgi:hypothetical protein
MRHLVRYLFTFCSAASLVLCVAVCVLWARSCRTLEVFGGTRRTGAGSASVWLFSNRGTLFAHVRVYAAGSTDEAVAPWPSGSFDWISELQHLGFFEGHFPDRFWNRLIGLRFGRGEQQVAPDAGGAGGEGLFGSAET